MDLNKVMLIGNLARDPEVRTTPQGASVVTFSVATNLRWTNPAGERQERTEFHNVVAWRKLADLIGQYLRRGSKVYIEGRLQTRSWDDAQGNRRYRTEVVAENMIMLDRLQGGPRSNEPAPPPQEPQEPEGVDQAPPAEEPQINVEDIPF